MSYKMSHRFQWLCCCVYLWLDYWSFKKITLSCTKYYSCVVGRVYTNKHKQLDPEELLIHICSVQGSNPRQAAQQPVRQPLHQPMRLSMSTAVSVYLLKNILEYIVVSKWHSLRYMDTDKCSQQRAEFDSHLSWLNIFSTSGFNY